MRIAMTSYPSFGGSASVAGQLAAALAARGHTVRFVATEPPPCRALPPDVAFDAVQTPGYALFGDGLYTVALANKLAEVAAAHDLDVLHVHYALPHAVSAYLARQMLGARAPRVVLTLHGSDVTRVGSDPAYLEAQRFAVLAADARTVPSRYLAAAARERLALPADCAIEVVANFVDCEAGAPPPPAARRAAAAELVGAEAHERVLCHVSNFRAVKRAADVVRIFARLDPAATPARLLMVGDGPDHAACRALADELGVSERVRWTGNVVDVWSTLHAADVFVSTSGEESFGVAALEALAAGVPVVATDVGGVSEVVRHGATGTLVPLGDLDAGAAAARALLADDALRARYAKAGLADAASRFAIARQVDAYEALYERLCGLRVATA